MRPERSSSAEASASPPWPCCDAVRGAQRAYPCPARLSRRAHSGGLDDLFCCCEVRLASEDGHVGHHGYVTDLLAAMLDGDDAGSAAVYACGPPAMLEAVRPFALARRRCRAGDGVPDGLRLRRLLGCAVPCRDGGYMRLCVDGRCRRGARRSPRRPRCRPQPSASSLAWMHPVINASGTFDAIAARRVYGDSC